MTVEPRPSKSRWWVKLAVVLGVLAFCAGIALIAAIVIGTVRESRAIESLRAAGEPLSPSEITFAQGRDGDVLEHALAFSRRYEESVNFRDLFYADATEFAQEVRAAAGWSKAVEPVDELLECLAENELDCREWAAVTDSKLADPMQARALTDCERALVRARGALAEPMLEAARAVCSATPDSAGRLSRSWKVQDGPSPGQDVRINLDVALAVSVLQDVLVARASEGRDEDARELLELSFRASSLVEDWPWVLGFLGWQIGLGRALESLRIAQPSLPPEADLVGLEAQISAVDVDACLLRALQGERAFGNEMFSAIRDGRLIESESSPSVDGLSGLLIWAWIGNDRAFYLETMTTAIDWARRPYLAVAPEMDASFEQMQSSLATRMNLVSMLLLPRLDLVIESAASTRANLALARAALLARREGAEAAIAFASASPDPFRDGPLQSRIDEDGVLVLWSVGVDLVDQGGRDTWNEEGEHYESGTYRTPDIVWRVLPR